MPAIHPLIAGAEALCQIDLIAVTGLNIGLYLIKTFRVVVYAEV